MNLDNKLGEISLPGGHHHLAHPGLIRLAVLLQEPAQPVLLSRHEANTVLVNLHQPLQSTRGFVLVS